MNTPLTTSGSFDPLAPAGGMARPDTTAASSGYKPGQFVQATIDGTAFFSKRPKGDSDADKLLPRNTRMKVISSDASYVRGELDSGEVGFVPTVMVHDPNSTIPAVIGDPSGGVAYPPLPDGGMTVETLPDLNPSNAPPDGIPPVIAVDPSSPLPPAAAGAGDPSTAPATAPAAMPEAAPGVTTPAQVAPTPAPAPAPAETPAKPATTPPLPPGGVDIDTGKAQ